MYDISDINSLLNIKNKWMGFLDRLSRSNEYISLPIILLGNKYDKYQEKIVNYNADDMIEIVHNIVNPLPGVTLYNTDDKIVRIHTTISARKGLNVEWLYDKIIEYACNYRINVRESENQGLDLIEDRNTMHCLKCVI